MTVRTEIDGPVWTIIHSRPEARNAMDPESAVALYQAFRDFEADASAAAAVFWGEGGAFCAGYDLKHAATLGADDGFSALDFDAESDPGQGPMGPSRMDLSKPVIAAIAGPAVAGGMELAMWCDIRVMEEDAFMGVYCRRWGVPLIDGGTSRLPRLVGQGRAMDLILTGRKVEAEECLRIGLCEYLAPHGEARAKAETLAHEIARFPQGTMRADRASAREQWNLSPREALAAEWRRGRDQVRAEGVAGAARFAAGKGRSGDFKDI